MKKEDLYKEAGNIDSNGAEKPRDNNKGGRRQVWLRRTAAAVCSAVVIAAVWAAVLRKDRQMDSDEKTAAGMTCVAASYPKPAAQTLSAQEFMEGNEHWKWWDSYRELISETEGLQAGMEDYNLALMGRLLSSENENTVCSPLNTYIAFAVLAEVSGGSTRQQILDMLGATDIETLRSNVSALWKSNYADTPVLKSLLANSVWLSSSVKYNSSTLNILAKDYRTSTFCGRPGSAEMDEALRTWTDDNTGGLLSEYTKSMSIEPDTVLEILSTIYYKAMWTTNFEEENTAREIFHGTSGDTEADMMHKDDVMHVYRTDSFTAVGLSLNDSGAMYFLLPEEGEDVIKLADNPDIMRMLRYDDTDENRLSALVHLAVPRFRVSGKTDLLEAVRTMGVTEALDPVLADFSPLTGKGDDLYLSKAEHAAMIEIDEQGVTGAAYTELALAMGAAAGDEMEFTLDRPFMFIVTGRDGSLLFAGIVRNIE